jgi:hypothetical protein
MQEHIPLVARTAHPSADDSTISIQRQPWTPHWTQIMHLSSLNHVHKGAMIQASSSRWIQALHTPWTQIITPTFLQIGLFSHPTRRS